MNLTTLEISSIPSLTFVDDLAKQIDCQVEYVDNSYAKITINNEIGEGQVLCGLTSFSFLPNILPVAWVKWNMAAFQDIDVKCMPDQGDDYFRIVFFESDKNLETITATNSYDLINGICFCSSGMEHHIKYPAGAKGTSITITVAKEWVKGNCADQEDTLIEQLLNNPFPIVIHEVMNYAVNSIYKSLMDNKLEGIADKIKFNHQLSGLLFNVFEQLIKNRKSIPKVKVKVPDVELMRKAEAHLIQSVKNVPSIALLAASAAMSETKFKNLFKLLYGKSVYDYYLHHRMEYAREQILANKMNITEIGMSMGYKNLSHFSRIFKRHYGEFPSKYNTY